MDYLPSLWAANGAARDAFDAAQMRNATCLCGANATAVLEGTARFMNASHYVANNCTGARGSALGVEHATPPGDVPRAGRLNARFRKAAAQVAGHMQQTPMHLAITLPPLPGIGMLSQRQWAANGTFTIATPGGVDPTICDEAITNLTNHRTALNATMLRWAAAGPGEAAGCAANTCGCRQQGTYLHCAAAAAVQPAPLPDSDAAHVRLRHPHPHRSWLVTQRLGNLATTGKIANRTAVVNTLRNFLVAVRPELVGPIFTAPKGGDAQTALQVGARGRG